MRRGETSKQTNGQTDAKARLLGALPFLVEKLQKIGEKRKSSAFLPRGDPACFAQLSGTLVSLDTSRRTTDSLSGKFGC